MQTPISLKNRRVAFVMLIALRKRLCAISPVHLPRLSLSRLPQSCANAARMACALATAQMACALARSAPLLPPPAAAHPFLPSSSRAPDSTTCTHFAHDCAHACPTGGSLPAPSTPLSTAPCCFAHREPSAVHRSPNIHLGSGSLALSAAAGSRRHRRLSDARLNAAHLGRLRLGRRVHVDKLGQVLFPVV